MHFQVHFPSINFLRCGGRQTDRVLPPSLWTKFIELPWPFAKKLPQVSWGTNNLRPQDTSPGILRKTHSHPTPPHPSWPDLISLGCTKCDFFFLQKSVLTFEALFSAEKGLHKLTLQYHFFPPIRTISKYSTHQNNKQVLTTRSRWPCGEGTWGATKRYHHLKERDS